MSKSMSVTFDDGTSHTYDNVPDYVTQEQVNARAQDDFADKKITDTAEGAHPEAPPLPTAEEQKAGQPSIAERALGMAMVPVQVAAAHPWETGAALGLYKAGSIGNKYVTAKNIEAEAQAKVAQTQAQTALENAKLQRERIAERLSRPGVAPAAGPQIEIPQSVGSGPRPVAMPQAAQYAQAQRVAQAAQQTQHAQQAAQVAQAAATGGPSAAQGSTFIQRMAQQFGGMAQRVAPILNNPAVRTAGQLGSVGGQFGLYHGGLNTNEEQELARRRGVGFQPYPRQ